MSSDEDRARELFEPRSYYEPGSGIIQSAVNHAAIDLLKSDPEEYFRLSRLWRELLQL